MRWIYSALFFLAGSVAAVSLSQFADDQTLLRDPDVDPSIPSPELSPEQVVACQVQAMQQSIVDKSHLVPCYSLASPQNRATTGPLSRFWTMCHSPPYDLLCTSDSWQIGSAHIEQQRASVTVSVLTVDGPLGFEFRLSRQQHAPLNGCWMTDAVAVLPIMDLSRPPIADGSVRRDE